MQYNPSFVCHRPILSDEDKRWLHRLALMFPLDRFTHDARHYEETTVDFVYTSAKIEGNTYDRIDTDNLLRLGVTAGGKRYSDAVMLINLRDGFDLVMSTDTSKPLDIDYLCDLHKVLMKDLLPSHEQGIVRTSPVTIGGSTYEPLSDAGRLRAESRFILDETNKYTDPFEKAIYLHCNLAYLQYFRDGNKRTSRMMQTAALVQAQILPLFFKDTLIEKYQRATIRYYESGDYAPYVAFFKENYELSISQLSGTYTSMPQAAATKEFNRRVSRLPDLQHTTGVGHTLWLLAQKEMALNASPTTVNWADIERRTIVDSIARHGLSPDLVGAILCQYSPGAISTDQQSAILQDIKRLAPDLQVQYRKERGGSGLEP